MTDKEIDKFYGAAADDRGARSQHEALISWAKGIESSKSKEPSESIPYLGRALLKLSSRNIFQVPERVVIYDAAQAAMLSIPGHAEYYRDRLLKAQVLYKTRRDGPSCSEYRDEQMYAFQILPHLPSPETVRVYGEMLFNDWAPPGNDEAIASEKLPLLSNRSTGGLSRLPIVNKPFREALSLANFADAQAAWRQWYDEIKDGKRTFRFEGDPAEYDLDGPAPARKLERIALAEKRDAERGRERVPGGTAADDAVPAMAGDGDGEGLPAAVSIAAAAFLCLSAGWYLVRRRGTGRAEWRR